MPYFRGFRTTSQRNLQNFLCPILWVFAPLRKEICKKCKIFTKIPKLAPALADMWHNENTNPIKGAYDGISYKHKYISDECLC